MNIPDLVFAAALATAMTAGPALAGERAEHVPYRDLDLATLEGQAELQQRLDSAARRVCRFADDGQLVTPADENACFRATRKTVDIQLARLTSETQLGG